MPPANIYKRLLPWLKPYWHQVVITIVCGLAAALIWGSSLTATWPVIKTILSDNSVAESVKTAIADIQTELDADRAIEAELQARIDHNNDSSAERDLERLRERQAEKQTELERYQWWNRTVIPRLPENRFVLLAVILALIFAATLLKGVCQYVQDRTTWNFTEATIRDLRNAMFRHAIELDYQNHVRRGTGDLLSRFGHDLQLLTVGLTVIGGRLVREPLKALVCLGIAFSLNWRLTLLSCVLLPLTFLLFYKIGQRLRKAGHQQMEAMSRLYSTLEETLANLKTAQLYGAAEKHLDDVRKDNADYYHRAMKIAKWESFTSPATETLGILAAFIALVPGAYLVLRQTTKFWGIELASRPMDIADLSTLYLLLIGTLDSLRRLSSVYARLKRAATAGERIFELLDEEQITPDLKTDSPTISLDQSIQYESIVFRYDQTIPDAAPILSDVSIEIPAGETVAIVGENGSGKSTLINLIPGFYSAESGCIRFDGQDLRSVSRAEIRQHISLVQQETFLFDDTISENIRYACPDATAEDVAAAADRAHVTEFLSAFPEGLGTRVGPGGGLLSGGQRQRVALARAILKDTPLLILDEATSAIDARSEALILESLQTFTKGRTTLIVTHSLPTEMRALVDRVLVMHNGEIAGWGTPAELESSSERFRSLFGTQALKKSA